MEKRANMRTNLKSDENVTLRMQNCNYTYGLHGRLKRWMSCGCVGLQSHLTPINLPIQIGLSYGYRPFTLMNQNKSADMLARSNNQTWRNHEKNKIFVSPPFLIYLGFWMKLSFRSVWNIDGTYGSFKSSWQFCGKFNFEFFYFTLASEWL